MFSWPLALFTFGFKIASWVMGSPADSSDTSLLIPVSIMHQVPSVNRLSLCFSNPVYIWF